MLFEEIHHHDGKSVATALQLHSEMISFEKKSTLLMISTLIICYGQAVTIVLLIIQYCSEHDICTIELLGHRVVGSCKLILGDTQN